MRPPADRPDERTRGAYTLIELSIALSIIGILASVSGSQYMDYLDRARTARAIVELRYIAAAIDPAGDDEAAYPVSLAAAGITTRDPWGNPYQYLLIQGNLPPGLSDRSQGMPDVAAPPSEPGGGGGGSPGGSGGGSPGGSGGGGPLPGAGSGSSGGSSGGGGGGGSGHAGGSGGGKPAIALARKDRFLVPINSDFDLYSMGPDGESQASLNARPSRDDIVRANDGAFYGVAVDF